MIICLPLGEASGILGYEMHSNGSGRSDLNLGYGPEAQALKDVATVSDGAFGKIAMNGKEVSPPSGSKFAGI